MDFSLTTEQEQLRQTVRKFAETEIKPHVMEWDEAQTFPLEAVKKLGALGILGTIFPEELGGSGMSTLDYVVVMEEIARVDPSVALIVAAHVSLCSNHIFMNGNDEQRKRYIPKLASGEWIGSWSLTEPESGSNAAGMRTTAVEADGGWVLNGTKAFTTNIHRAHACVVMAVTDPGHDNRSISAFVVENGTPGFRAGRKENKMGMRASDTGEAIFEGCHIPAGNLIGRRGHGFIDTLKVLDSGRASIAALGVGLAQGAYEAALKYAHERKQFDRPIYDFQAIQHKLTDMAMEIEAARLLTYQAAWMVDQGMRVTKQAAMAKLFSSEAAVRIANEALQVHGGYGFIKDYPVEKYYRDAKLLTIGEGTSEIQRLVIARQIILKH